MLIGTRKGWGEGGSNIKGEEREEVDEEEVMDGSAIGGVEEEGG